MVENLLICSLELGILRMLLCPEFRRDSKKRKTKLLKNFDIIKIKETKKLIETNKKKVVKKGLDLDKEIVCSAKNKFHH